MTIKDAWQEMDNSYLYMALSYLSADLFLEERKEVKTLKAIAIRRLMNKLNSILLERAYNA